MQEIYDVAIIGAGPVGMAAGYYVGTRGLKPVIIDSQPLMGGQCITLYPEKVIYDVASQPALTGTELIENLKNQLSLVPHQTLLDTSVEKLDYDAQSGIWHLTTTAEKILCKVIIISAGKGSFQPRKLNVPGENLKGIFYSVKSLSEFHDEKVLIVGGGDSAFDWSMALIDKVKTHTQIHRSNQYRAHGISVQQVQSASSEGKLRLLPFYEVEELLGDENGVLCAARIFNNKTKEKETIEVSKAIISAGFLTDLGNLANWGLEIHADKITVNPHTGYLSNLANVFAIGDIAHYDGKVELITTGFGEAATAAFYAYKAIHGDVKGAAWCAKLPASVK